MPRSTRLALPHGVVRLTSAQLALLVALLGRVQTDAAWLPRDLFADRPPPQLANQCRHLAAKGVLERTPVGYRLPHPVRDALRRRLGEPLRE